MVAVDTSSFVALLAGEPGADVTALDAALEGQQAALPPVVLTELLSAPALPPAVASLILQLPVLAPLDGFWERAGRMRARVLTQRLRARLADTLIAQSCIDHRVPLITRDADFRHFAAIGGLRLAS